jgi:hypothetical protein
VYRNAELPEVETAASVVTLDFAKLMGWERKKEAWPLMAVAAALRDTEAYPVEALREAAGQTGAAAVDAGLELG